MSQSKWDDAYDRLTSRKLILCLISVALAAYGHFSGHLSYVEFQTAVFAAIGVYTVSEGITDAVGAYRPKPAPGDVQSVNVGAAPVPAVKPTPKRVRPSRAKKPKEGVGG